jgi:hypothetical protein
LNEGLTSLVLLGEEVGRAQLSCDVN